MPTLTENLATLRSKMDYLILMMQDRGVAIEAGANFTTIVGWLGSDPILTGVTVDAILQGDNIFEKTNSTITSLRDYACYKHEGIQHATFAYCTDIGSYAFAECPNLETLWSGHFPGGVTIGDFAFSGCTALTGFNGEGEAIFNAVKQVGRYAFKGCTSLTKLLECDLSEFGENAFSGCTNLMTVKCNITKSDKSTPSDFDNYPWGLPSGCVITYGGKTYTVE